MPTLTRVRGVLAESTLDGLRLTLPAELDRATYEAVDRILANLGGRWTRAAGAHVFRRDPSARLTAFIAGGPAPQPPRRTHGFVPTPADVAEDITGRPYSDLDALPAGARVLEPSAGDGALVRAILDANGSLAVTAVEPDPDRAADITDERCEVVVSTLEGFHTQWKASGAPPFDAVVMNPPFSATTQDVTGLAGPLWARHVLLALEMLAPGGRLVAILPLAYRSHSSQTAGQLRMRVDALRGRFDRLPAEAFQPSGVSIGVGVLALTRPLRDLVRVADLPPWATRALAEAGNPVRVERPQVHGAAALATPVQVYYCHWRNRDRVLRYRSQCAGCGWLLWAFDDGDNDPRGILGDWSAGFSLDEELDDIGLTGLSVGLCPLCGSDGDRYREALQMAASLTKPAAPAPSPRRPASEAASAVHVQGELFAVAN